MSRDFAKRCQVANNIALNSGYAARLLPNAKRRGAELSAGDIFGGPGHSFSLNLSTGKWADFAHDDHRGGDIISLVATREKCSQGEALEILEREFGLGQLPPKPGKDLPQKPAQGPPTRSWDYTDEHGRVLYTAQRWEEVGYRKNCRMIVHDERAERVPLYLSEVLAAIERGKIVFITEGEPKADLLRSWGLCATSFAGGVNGFKDSQAKWFRGARLVIINDADLPGRQFAQALAESVHRQDIQGLKIVELPGARFEGYDLVDWQADGGTCEALSGIIQAAPLYTPVRERVRPLQGRLEDGSGLRDLDYGPQPYNWLIEDSLRRGQLGIICGPPGCCKGAFSIQLATALAAGFPVFDFWKVAKPAKVLFVSAEDDDEVLHNRFHSVLMRLPWDVRREAAGRLCRMPVRGNVNICEVDKNRHIAPTENLEDLRAWVESFQPDLLILDTLARFFGVDENDNPTVTAACGLLEQIIADYGCNVVLIHHASKAGGDLAGDEKKLHAALTQIAIRGASALSGCVRWALMLAPLSAALAQKKFGEEAKGKPEGSYIAARVGKKNAGKSEQTCYLEKGDYGLLSRILPESERNGEEEAAAMEDAHQLAAEVDRRDQTGLPALSYSRSGREAFGWGEPRTKRAVDLAIENGLVIKSKKEGARGFILAPPLKEENSE